MEDEEIGLSKRELGKTDSTDTLRNNGDPASPSSRMDQDIPASRGRFPSKGGPG